MQVNKPLRNTLEALAIIPVLAFMAATRLFTLVLAVAFLAVVFVGTLALAVAGPVLLGTVLDTALVIVGNYALHFAFGVVMLPVLKLTAIGFFCSVTTLLVRRLR